MFGKFDKFSIRNNQINLLYSVYSCEIELNFVFQYDDLFHQNESLYELPFLGLNFPHPSLLVVRSVRVEEKRFIDGSQKSEQM